MRLVARRSNRQESELTDTRFFSEEDLTLIDKSVLCWLATISPEGSPSVSPKEMFRQAASNEIAIADIASANSVRNIRENPSVCVSMLDIFRQRGAKFLGSATVLPKGTPEFDRTAGPLIEKAGSKFKIRNVILVTVDRVVPIVAPSYVLFPDTTVEDMMEDAFASYGVRPTSQTA